ncbi:MAG: AAA family ATPase [Bryobacteraceae bacterium]
MHDVAKPEFGGTARFTLVRRVGSGGMGVVYEAFDNDWRLRVALKTVTRLDPRFLYLFKQEFRSLSGITHPHLVQLYELIASDEHWFFTMEFVDGVPFLHHVWGREQKHSLPSSAYETATATVACDIAGPGGDGIAGLIVPTASGSDSPARMDVLRESMRQLAEGVSALHQAGKLHRDIKPSNLMVREGGHLILLDFGLVSDLGAGRVGDIAGTVTYMAPEQASGRPLTEAADWYSVGVTLYEALTGVAPFRGVPAAVMQAKRELPVCPPHEVVTGVPADLEELCLELLRPDAAARPSGNEILQRLGGRLTATAQTAIAPPILVGREPHLAALESAYAAAVGGRTVAVFVHGASGFGKSSLVDHFLERRARAGESVELRGRCYEQESVPYKAFDALIDSLSRHLSALAAGDLREILPQDLACLARLFPVMRRFERNVSGPAVAEGIDQFDLRRRAFTALRQLLHRLAERAPLILFIDDLQWGDIDSARLLNEILREASGSPLLVICSYRSEYAHSSACLAALSFGPSIDRRELPVGALDFDDARRLALAMLPGAPSTQHAESIARESKGSPYFVRELATSVHPATGGEVSLDSVLWNRVSGLPPASLKLLEVISVSGRPLLLADAVEVAGGVDDPSLLGLLRATRLIRGSGVGRGDQVEPYHDRIRETVVAHLEPPVLRGHHLRLAVTLARTPGTDPERLAVHYLGGGEERIAGRYFSTAAEQAAQALAFDRAAELCKQAIALTPLGEEERQQLEVSLADALANGGRGPMAAQQYLTAAAQATPAQRMTMNQRAAYHFCASGYVDEGRAAFRDVLGQVGLKLPRSRNAAFAAVIGNDLRLRFRGLKFRERLEAKAPPAELARADAAWDAAIGLSMVDIVAGAGFAKRAVLEALRTGEPYRIARSVSWEAAHRAGLGPAQERQALRWLDDASGLAARSGHPKAIAWAKLAAGVAYLQIGRWRSAVDTLDEAQRLLREYARDIAWEMATADTCLLFALNDVGNYAEMARRTPAILETGRERGNLFVVTNIGAWVMPQLRLAAGDPESARKLAAEASARWSQQGFHLQHLYTLIQRVSASIYEGKGERAVTEIDAEWKAAAGSLLFHAHLPRSFTIHVRARAYLRAAERSANPKPLVGRVLSDAKRLDKEQARWASAAAELLRAGAAQVRGDQDGALRHLRDAERGFVEGEMGHYLAATRYRLAALVGGDEGRAFRALADEWTRAQGIAEPDRFTALHAPGFVGFVF